MSLSFTDSEWLLPALNIVGLGLPIALAIWIAWRIAKRTRSRARHGRSQFAGTLRSLFPPEGAIVEEQRRRGR